MPRVTGSLTRDGGALLREGESDGAIPTAPSGRVETVDFGSLYTRPSRAFGPFVVSKPIQALPMPLGGKEADGLFKGRPAAEVPRVVRRILRISSLPTDVLSAEVGAVELIVGIHPPV